jgi:hypothetical protein
MLGTRPVTPPPGTGRHSPLAAARARWAACSPLAREIAVILIVKATVLGLLWFAFFRAPAAPGMAMDPQRVVHRLGVNPPAPEAPDAVR